MVDDVVMKQLLESFATGGGAGTERAPIASGGVAPQVGPLDPTIQAGQPDPTIQGVQAAPVDPPAQSSLAPLFGQQDLAAMQGADAGGGGQVQPQQGVDQRVASALGSGVAGLGGALGAGIDKAFGDKRGIGQTIGGVAGTLVGLPLSMIGLSDQRAKTDVQDAHDTVRRLLDSLR